MDVGYGSQQHASSNTANNSSTAGVGEDSSGRTGSEDEEEKGAPTSAVTNETTSLISTKQDGTTLDDDDDAAAAAAPSSSKSKARNSWGKITDHVLRGSFLLHHSTHSDDDEKPDRESKRQQAEVFIRGHLDFTLPQCIVAILCYIGVAVVAFSFVFERWTIIDSVYFSVVTFSTVGYGDVVPSTHAARCFTGFFALSSIGCLGLAIGVVGRNIIDAQEKALGRAKALSERRVLTLFSSSRHRSDISLSPESPATNSSNKNPNDNTTDAFSYTTTNTMFPGEQQAKTEVDRLSNLFFRVVSELAMVAGVLFVFGVAVAQDPAIEASDVGYFLVITSTAIGYGDVAPTSQRGRLVTAIFIPLAVGAMGRWLAMGATWIIQNRQKGFRRYLETHELTAEDLDVMDDDGDGHVSRAEFLEFMLVAMGKVDRDLIDQLKASFVKLDVEGNGVLSKGDLVALARRKLKDPKRKLELARYKSQLLEQAQTERRRHRRSRSGTGRRSSIWG